MLDGTSRGLARRRTLFNRGVGRAKLPLRLLHRRRARIAATAGLGHLIGGHELAIYQALNTTQVVCRIGCLRLKLGHSGFRRRPLLLCATDFGSSGREA